LPPRIVLLGAPASGKGTQAALLGKHLKVPYLSTGALIRAEQERGSRIGNLADQYLEGGGFLPDPLMIEIMGAWLAGEGSRGFVLDGFPRTLPQAEAFDASLAKNGIGLDAAILLQIDGQLLHDRTASRIQCSTCGSTLRIDGSVGVEEGSACPKPGCGGKLSRREDDSPAVYANRLERFNQLTRPVVQYYEKVGKLKRVDGAACSEDVFQQILDSLPTATY